MCRHIWPNLQGFFVLFFFQKSRGCQKNPAAKHCIISMWAFGGWTCSQHSQHSWLWLWAFAGGLRIMITSCTCSWCYDNTMVQVNMVKGRPEHCTLLHSPCTLLLFIVWALVFHEVLVTMAIQTESIYPAAGIILYMRPAHERKRHIVTLSLIGWLHTQNDPCSWAWNYHPVYMYLSSWAWN